MKNKQKRWNEGKMILILFVCFLLLGYYFFVIIPVIKTYSEAETNALTERAVNMAVSNVINRTLSYDSLIDINYDAKGEIVSFAANQYEINTITREIIKETQYHMNDFASDGLMINIGTFSGIPFFIGRGPLIPMKLIPVGVVSSKFESSFSSVGINMTKHTLSLFVNVHVSIVLPIKEHNIYSVNQILLAESVIVGKVPEVFLNGGSLGESLNLIP